MITLTLLLTVSRTHIFLCILNAVILLVGENTLHCSIGSFTYGKYTTGEQDEMEKYATHINRNNKK